MSIENKHVLSAEPSPEVLSAILQELGVGEAIYTAIEGDGMENRVYKISSASDCLILRLNSAGYAKAMFEKEALCLNKANKIGIPSPRFLSRGSLDDWHYATHSFCKGVVGSKAELKPSVIWQNLGRYARLIHEVETEGFGTTLSSTNSLTFTVSWQEWVEKELQKIAQDEELLKAGILSDTEKQIALDLVGELKNWQFPPKLCHGDLSLGNVLIGKPQTAILIDWGNAISHRAPHYDFAEINIWNPDGEALKAVAQGYDLNQSELEVIQEESKVIELWRGLWAARRDIAHSSAWKTSPYIERSLAAIRRAI